jgi:hypothetical protein
MHIEIHGAVAIVLAVVDFSVLVWAIWTEWKG